MMRASWSIQIQYQTECNLKKNLRMHSHWNDSEQREMFSILNQLRINAWQYHCIRFDAEIEEESML